MGSLVKREGAREELVVQSPQIVSDLVVMGLFTSTVHRDRGGNSGEAAVAGTINTQVQ